MAEHVLSDRAAARLLALFRQGEAGAAPSGRGRDGALLRFVKCLSATAAGGSAILAQCYPAQVLEPAADYALAPEAGGLCLLSLVGDGGAAAAPVAGRVYLCVLTGDVAGDAAGSLAGRPRAFGVPVPAVESGAATDSVPTFDASGDLQGTPAFVTGNTVNGDPAAQWKLYTVDNPTGSTPYLFVQTAEDGDGAGSPTATFALYPTGSGGAVGSSLVLYRTGGTDYGVFTGDTFEFSLSLLDLSGVTEIDFTGVTITGFTGGGTRTEGTAAADGSTQSDATQLTDDTTVVSGADGTKGVKLKNSAAGIIAVENTTASTLKVYPPTGAQISALGTNTAYSQLGNEKRAYWRFSSTQWYTSLLS